MRTQAEFLTGPLLAFRGGEEGFRSTVELARPYSLDLALFGVQVALVASGIGYIRSGGASEIAVRLFLMVIRPLKDFHIIRLAL